MKMDSGVAIRRLGRSPAQLLALSVIGIASAAINNDAQAYEVKFNDTASVGPDGPWNYILLADPENGQYIATLPSVARTTLYVNETACGMLGATCPPPKEETWHAYDAWEAAGGSDTKSYLMPASDWDSDYAALFNFTGAGGYFVDQIVLHHDADENSPANLGNQAIAISKDWTVNLGASHQYTRSVGLFSLNASAPIINYGKTQDESVNANTALQTAYDDGYIPSLSYGLHIGSAEPSVSGSLVLGGYDKSRILSDAIIAGNNSLFRLTDIALNVSSGGQAFLEASSAYNNGLLKTPSDHGEYVIVQPRPGLPYMYLPKQTCDAIANFLPVTYSADYNLYLWDTESSAYEDIISSPHYLSFVFSDDTKPTAHINVPFALLNLTLDTPLAKTPTQYFPCSPWEADTTGYTLGNAFLQAAFLSQHWQMNTTVLAQAPGPDYHETDVQVIPYNSDTAVGAATAAADWATTWATTLKALSNGQHATSSSGTTSSSTASENSGNRGTSGEKESASSISGGAIAGIVIGAVGGIALIAAAVFFLMRQRRKKTQRRLSSTGVSLQNQSAQDEASYRDSPHAELEASGAAQAEHKPVYEVETTHLTELPGQQRAYELSGDGLLAEKPAH